jgi:hypothetical protein
MATLARKKERKKERKKGVWSEGEYRPNICHITMDACM